MIEVLRHNGLDALGEEDVSLRQYGQGGGFWDGLAFYLKQAIVEDANLEETDTDSANNKCRGSTLTWRV